MTYLKNKNICVKYTRLFSAFPIQSIPVELYILFHTILLLISFHIFFSYITKNIPTFHVDDNPPCFSTTSIAIQVNPHHNTTLLLCFNPNKKKTYYISKKKKNVQRNETNQKTTFSDMRRKIKCYMMCFFGQENIRILIN